MSQACSGDRGFEGALDLSERSLHNSGTADGSGLVTVTTPAAQWAYAVEFPLPSRARDADAAADICVDLAVRRGEIGIGCLDDRGALLVEKMWAASDGDGIVRLPLASLRECRSVVIRNTGNSFEPSVAVIRAIGIAKPDTAETTLVVDPALFEAFKGSLATIRSGVWTNWLGVKSRIDRAPISMEYCVLRDRPQEADIPYLGTYKLLDWATIFEAVLSAGDPFVMVSVGAGYGLFACTSAFAAMQTGRAYRLVGVEAEPQHVEWMEEHFQDNGLDPQWYRLIRAAASDRSGAHWFPMDAPHEYGRAVLPDLAVPGVPPGSVPLWGEIEHAGQRFQRVPAVTIGEILSGLPSADYVEVDIQGTEFEFLSAQPDILQERVRMLRVQTHSSATDRKMHRLFSDLGWISRYAAPFNSEVTASLGNGVTRGIRFGDGVQTWINPRIHS